MTDRSYSPVFAGVTALAGVLGALCLLVSTVLFITEGNGINDGVLGGTVGVWACLGLALGSVGIARLLEERAPTAAPFVGAIALVGFMGGVAFNVQAMYLARYDVDFLDDVGPGGESSGSDWFGFFAFLPWGLMVPAGLVLFGWLLWRTEVAQTRVAALFVLGGVMFVSGRPARIEAVAVATDVVFVLAFVSMAPVLLRAACSRCQTGSRSEDVAAGRMSDRSEVRSG